MMLTEYRHLMKRLVPAILVAMFCATPGAVLSAGDQEPPIIKAALDGDLDKLRSLIDAGADVNAEDNEGTTPLMLAAYEGYEEVVKILIEAGADVVNARDSTYGKTPLMWAAAGGHESAVKILIEAGADVKAEDNDGDTPLMVAAERSHEDVVKYS